MSGSPHGSSRDRIGVALEAGEKRTFATAVDWPGWSRSGKGEGPALEALAAYATRYEPIARRAGEPFDASSVRLEALEHGPGGSGTDFGVPSRIGDADRRPTSAADGERLARLVEAAWAELAAVAAVAPEALRKGPRGGGRDKTKMLAHVSEADWYYARELGVRVPNPGPDDAAALAAMRSAMLDVLRAPSDGEPLAGRRWTVRYAAQRIAWHALDHAWEMQDRSTP
ncbi:MAG TPA: hypothetical protein VJ506_08585 [Candidatus Limnocylindrales bacterium]|nr:hypothetical protein [Candidatus Limnocylindrales bacterium]